VNSLLIVFGGDLRDAGTVKNRKIKYWDGRAEIHNAGLSQRKKRHAADVSALQSYFRGTLLDNTDLVCFQFVIVCELILLVVQQVACSRGDKMPDWMSSVWRQEAERELVPALTSNVRRPSPWRSTICPVADLIDRPLLDGVTYLVRACTVPMIVVVEPESTKSPWSERS
jgi:hypothetical protein